mmetsp:Transcript_57853/g.136101  ORF Transcript_57853/g.136101 Transcript_57853/m.136101 type:complete len:330 (-) Transcript_57853:137-1126(-)
MKAAQQEMRDEMKAAQQETRDEMKAAKAAQQETKAALSRLEHKMHQWVDDGVWDKLLKGSVVIYHRLSKQGSFEGVGRGFITRIDGDDVVVTCAHVVTARNWCGQLAVKRLGGTNIAPITKDDCALDTDLDIAIIKVSGCTGLALDHVQARDTDFQGSRRPSYVLAGVQMLSQEQKKDPSMMFVELRSMKHAATAEPEIQYNAEGYGGDSGAPIVSRDGRVLAVHCGFLNEYAGCRNTPRKTAKQRTESPVQAYNNMSYGKLWCIVLERLTRARSARDKAKGKLPVQLGTPPKRGGAAAAQQGRRSTRKRSASDPAGQQNPADSSKRRR